MKHFYGHSLPSADLRRAVFVVFFLPKELAQILFSELSPSGKSMVR